VRLLVVEDEPRLGRALQRGLAAEGYRVDVATDGVEGLERARHDSYDAVILDIMLPRLSGYRVVRALRDEGNWVPVLILSAKDGEYDEADGLDCGADDYLTKPFSFVVLLARLRALQRRGAPERPAVLTVGSLRLDPASRRVTRGDHEVVLTAREYALLEYMMRRKDQVITKIELLDRVWDAAADTDPNVVEVYVGYLRRKIDQPYGCHSVETVRGAGYRLADDGMAPAGAASSVAIRPVAAVTPSVAPSAVVSPAGPSQD
jgi:two-component system OmpR family response regulator